MNDPGPNATKVRDTLVGSDPEDSIRVLAPAGAEIEVVFTDNAIVNGHDAWMIEGHML